MIANLTRFGQNAAQKAAEKAAMIAESVTAQSRAALDYEIGAEVGAAGPDGTWKIHRARPIRTGAGGAFYVWFPLQFAASLGACSASPALPA
jgi:hypothetical protein